MSDKRIRIVAYLELTPGKQDKFEELVRQAVDYVSASEPETLIYDWYVSDDGTSARIYELYESAEAVLTHLGGKAVSEILPSIIEFAPLTRIEAFGKPSDQLVSAASQLPVTFYGEAFAGLDRRLGLAEG